jgi:hypothetical protein
MRRRDSNHLRFSCDRSGIYPQLQQRIQDKRYPGFITTRRTPEAPFKPNHFGRRFAVLLHHEPILQYIVAPRHEYGGVTGYSCESTSVKSTIATETTLQKLVVIGGTVETARRASVSAWHGFVDCAYACADVAGH